MFKKIAINFFVFVILFILLNLIIYSGKIIRDIWDEIYNTAAVNVYSTPSDKYGIKKINQIYSDSSIENVDLLLTETWQRPFSYEPYTQFKEAIFNGKYVNVNKNGFRDSINQTEFNIDSSNPNIFVFGGSSTFGYGVKDNETIPSYIKIMMKSKYNIDVNVFNFGRGNYYSTQELILFLKLLQEDKIPDYAIFINGLNEFLCAENIPTMTVTIEKKLNDNLLSIIYNLLNRLPVSKLINYDFQRNAQKRKERDIKEEKINSSICNLQKNELKLYLKNLNIKNNIAKLYDIKVLNVWQPISNYKYNNKYHLFPIKSGIHQNAPIGYEMMEEYIKNYGEPEFFLNLSKTQLEIKEPLYVDGSHYTYKFNKIISEHIVNFMHLNY